jgi:transcriptional antiterminator NusG
MADIEVVAPAPGVSQAPEANPEPEASASPVGVAGMAALPAHHQWYVIHTYSGFENKVKQSIEQRVSSVGMSAAVSQVMIPTETVVELKKGKRREASQKFFPGYVLIRMEMSDDLWYLIKNTPKVTGFVGPGVRPTPIPEEQVRTILKQVESGAERPKHRILFSRGESVRVIDGPTPVDLEFLQVERV